MGGVASTSFIYTERVLPTSLGAWMGGQGWRAQFPTLLLVSTCGFQRLLLALFDLVPVQIESAGPGQDEPQQLHVLPPQGLPTVVLFCN